MIYPGEFQRLFYFSLLLVSFDTTRALIHGKHVYFSTLSYRGDLYIMSANTTVIDLFSRNSLYRSELVHPGNVTFIQVFHNSEGHTLAIESDEPLNIMDSEHSISGVIPELHPEDTEFVFSQSQYIDYSYIIKMLAYSDDTQVNISIYQSSTSNNYDYVLSKHSSQDHFLPKDAFTVRANTNRPISFSLVNVYLKSHNYISSSLCVPSVNNLGMIHIAPNFKPHWLRYSVVVITSSSDNTEVTIRDKGKTYSKTLTEIGYYRQEIVDSAVVICTKPCLVTEANYALIPSVAHYVNDYRFYVPGGYDPDMYIIARTDMIDYLIYDGSSISHWIWSDIEGLDDYKKTVQNVSSGHHHIYSNHPSMFLHVFNVWLVEKLESHLDRFYVVSRSRATCGKPSEIKNGYVIGDKYKIRDTINYQCDPGYTFAESDVSYNMTCNAYGQWEGNKPNCIIACGKPSEIENGFVIGDKYKIGDTIHYQCDPGYTFAEPDVSYNMTCNIYRQWEGKEPKCMKACGKPSEIENGYVIGDKYKIGDIIHYQCDPGYTFAEPDVSYNMTCNIYRQWEGKEPKCMKECWIFKEVAKDESGFESMCFVVETRGGMSEPKCFLLSCQYHADLLSFRNGVCILHLCQGNDLELKTTNFGWNIYTLTAISEENGQSEFPMYAIIVIVLVTVIIIAGIVLIVIRYQRRMREEVPPPPIPQRVQEQGLSGKCYQGLELENQNTANDGPVIDDEAHYDTIPEEKRARNTKEGEPIYANE